MSGFVGRLAKKAGSAPGTLVHVGEKRSEAVQVSMMHYDPDRLIEQPLEAIDAPLSLIKPSATTWINVDGIHDIAFMETLGRLYGIHPLTLEDVLNTTQRPKAESYENYLFVVLKMMRYDERENQILSEQISLILGHHWLITLQEARGDVFEPVRERIRKGKGRIRTDGCDYLAYALIDAVVDHYFVVLGKIGERLENLEEALDDHCDAGALEETHAVRRELIHMRKQIWPLRELISHLQKTESPFIRASTGLFMRDVYDHTIQIIDSIESFRDLLAAMQDLYLSMVSNRMNEVMKVLTIIATIFIPVSFIAGIYGMNFQYMPELTWRWGYPAVWGLMLVMGGGMLAYFKRKKWL